MDEWQTEMGLLEQGHHTKAVTQDCAALSVPRTPPGRVGGPGTRLPVRSEGEARCSSLPSDFLVLFSSSRL